MATKSSTIFSTNPKMDTSGVKAKMRQMGYDMRPLPPKEITGEYGNSCFYWDK